MNQESVQGEGIEFKNKTKKNNTCRHVAFDTLDLERPLVNYKCVLFCKTLYVHVFIL